MLLIRGVAPSGIDITIRIRRAIHLNDLTLLKRIIKNNSKSLQNPDHRDNGDTSLHLAAKLGLLEITEFLIDAGHEDESISRNANWDTPLHIAVESSEAVATLIAMRFPRCIPWKNKQGADAIILTSRTPHAHLLSHLLTISPPPNVFTPLPLPRPSPTSASGLANPLSAIHATDNLGNTPLHYASAYGQRKCIRTLLEHGADAGARNAWSWTPVSYSASVQDEVCFKNLVGVQERERGQLVGNNQPQSRSRGGSGGRSTPGGIRVVGKEEEWGGEGFSIPGEWMRSSGETARMRAGSGD
ncbi:hypothetical protein N7G274_002179 [Stereocaulon virgatum]|uniref:Ankyrin n=1 Tax=Stereocaulon virgatum TaxID=373712 RepID=A0ABR4AIZ6_9LECA